jgi:hypothetical protein
MPEIQICNNSVVITGSLKNQKLNNFLLTFNQAKLHTINLNCPKIHSCIGFTLDFEETLSNSGHTS